jgi:hypothetical protein
MSKKFWGYNTKEEAESIWKPEILATGIRTEKVIDVVDDATKWSQTSSKQTTIVRIELEGDVISYAL